MNMKKENQTLSVAEFVKSLDKRYEERKLDSDVTVPVPLKEILKEFNHYKVNGRDVIEFDLSKIQEVGGKVTLPTMQRNYIIKFEKLKNDYEWCNKVVLSAISTNYFPTTILIGITPSKKFLQDGLQRCSTLYSYYKGKFKLKFTDTETGLVGEYYFHELPEHIQERLLNCLVQCRVVTGSETAVRLMFLSINEPSNPLSMGEYLATEYSGPLMERIMVDFGRDNEDVRLPVPGIPNQYYNDKNSTYYLAKYFPKNKPELGFYKGDFLERGNIIVLAVLISACVEFRNELIPYIKTKRCLRKGGFKPDADETYKLIRRYLSKHQYDPTEIDTIHENLKRFISYVNNLINNSSWRLANNRTSDDKKKRQFLESQPWAYLFAMYMYDNSMFLCDTNLYEMTDNIYDVVDNINDYSNTYGVVEWAIRGCKPEERCVFIGIKELNGDRKQDLFNRYYGFDILTGKRMDKNDLKTKGKLKVYRIKKHSLHGSNNIDNVYLLPEWSHTILSQTKTITEKEIIRRAKVVLNILTGWDIDHPDKEISEQLLQREMKRKGVIPVSPKDYDVTK